MTAWVGVMLLLLQADGGARESVRSLEDAQAVFLKLRLGSSNFANTSNALMKNLALLDARWEDVARDASAPQLVVTALVRRGELRWHVAEVLSGAQTPEAIARLGEEAVVTWQDAVRDEVASLRAEARVQWQRAAAFAEKHRVKSADLEAVRDRL
jgi:hypothetical protein